MKLSLSLASTFLTLALLYPMPANGFTVSPLDSKERAEQMEMLLDLPAGATVLLTNIDKNGAVTERIVKTPESEAQLKAKARFLDGAQTFPLKVKSSPDKNGNNEIPMVIYAMKDTLMFWRSEGSAEATFNLPQGVYNLQIVYNDEYKSDVLIPGVELNGAKEINVNADMADKFVYLKMLMPDGSPMTLSSNSDPEFQFNTSQIACHQVVLANGCAQWFHTIQAASGGANTYKNFTMKCNFGTNTLACWNALTWKTNIGNIGYALTKDGENLKNGDIVQTLTSDFFEMATKYEHTPKYFQSGNGNSTIQMCMSLYRPTGGILSGFGLNISEPTKYFVCAPKLEPGTHYGMGRFQDYDVFPKYGRKIGVYSPSIANTQSGLQFLCTQEDNALYNVRSSAATAAQARNAAPINPNFSFKFDSTYVMCSSAPYASAGAKFAKTDSTIYMAYSVGAYYGNYGENRFVDAQYYNEKAKYDGEEVDLSKYRNVNGWLAELAGKKNQQRGEIQLSFINTNAKVGELDAKNICEISFKEGAEDVVSPTVQRLMFRNNADIPTINFEKPEDCKITLAGGDFNPVETNVNFGAYQEEITTYNYADATLKVEISPYG